MEWECHTYVVWECHTRWNENVIPMWYGNVIPDGMRMSYLWYGNVIPDGMGIPWDHTMEMKPYHTMWNHTTPDHTMKMESWSHTIPWEWNLSRISHKLEQVE